MWEPTGYMTPSHKVGATKAKASRNFQSHIFISQDLQIHTLSNTILFLSIAVRDVFINRSQNINT